VWLFAEYLESSTTLTLDLHSCKLHRDCVSIHERETSGSPVIMLSFVLRQATSESV
jgi:hypothetical protein